MMYCSFTHLQFDPHALMGIFKFFKYSILTKYWKEKFTEPSQVNLLLEQKRRILQQKIHILSKNTFV